MDDQDQQSAHRPVNASDEHHPAHKRPHLPHAHHNPNDEQPEAKASSDHTAEPTESKTETDPALAALADQASGQPVSFGSGPEIEHHPEPVDVETSSGDILPPKPIIDSKKLATVSAGVLVVSLVLGGVWFQLNRHVYSLGGQSKTVAQETSPTTSPETLGANAGPKTLALSLNLKPLTQGHYQAWIVQGDKTTSLGGFNTETSGPIKNLDGTPFAPTINLSSDQPAEVVITVEAGQEVVADPSKTVILSGEIQDGKATLSFTAMNLSQAGGVYTITSPTNGNDTDERSGLWFAKSDGQTLTGPGLTLPEAPAGWKYEAQMMYKSAVVAMGRFSKVDQVDEFNKYSTNPDKSPSFPGEDFLQKPPASLGLEFPADITNGEWKTIISVEPDVNGTDPSGDDTFYIQPLTANIASGTEVYKEYSLTFDQASLPTGSAELK